MLPGNSGAEGGIEEKLVIFGFYILVGRSTDAATTRQRMNYNSDDQWFYAEPIKIVRQRSSNYDSSDDMAASVLCKLNKCSGNYIVVHHHVVDTAASILCKLREQ